MKTIQSKKQKHIGLSQLSQNHFISIWGYFLENFKTFHRFIEEKFAHLYQWYVRNIEFVSILK